jgi:hypothetical protein
VITPAYPDVVTGPGSDSRPAGARASTLDELAQRCHARPVADANELAADIWASDDELDEFLADLRASRSRLPVRSPDLHPGCRRGS